MILHIVSDEKYIDIAYKSFEKASPGNNEFMIVSYTKEIQFKHIKNTPMTPISPYEFLSKKFARSLKKYDFIIIHGLFSDSYLQLVMNADKNIKFVWIGWGADYYKLLDRSLYLKKTLNLYQSITKKNKISIIQKIKNFIKQNIYLRDIDDREKAINRINYFAPVLKEEYFLIKNSLKNFRPKFIDWNYGSLEDVLSGIIDKRVNGRNILIGNSATFSGNHLEAFDIIKKLNIENRQIIVPLSYGNEIHGYSYGNEIYRNEIIKRGKNIFKNNFYPLIDFMPLEEYNELISTCSIVIMNHLRQQAGGNIIVMLYLGAKIFLNKENLFYEFYKNKGAIIFSMDELNNENISNNLTDEEVEINRNVLRNTCTENVVIHKTKTMIDIVMKDKK